MATMVHIREGKRAISEARITLGEELMALFIVSAKIRFYSFGLVMVILNKGLPFSVRVPNQTTLDTFRKTDAGEELVRCQNAEELFESLGI